MPKYLVNDIKICQNVKQKLYEDLNLMNISREYNELIELIELFKTNTWPQRESELKVHKRNIDKRYLPYIHEAKRVLKNTNKRLEYNIKKSMSKHD